MFTGGSPQNVFHLRQTLQAVFLAGGVGPPELQQRLRNLTRAVLRLSNNLVAIAGANRHDLAEPRAGLVFPDEEHRAHLHSAVDLTEAQLRWIIGTEVGALTPLVRDLNVDGPPGNSPTTGVPLFELHPILRDGDRYVIAGPTDLAVALRHRLISSTLEAGLREELTNRLWETTVGEVLRSCERMDWRMQAVMEPADEAAVGAVVFGFDVDKAAVVAVVGDDLTDYSSTDPEAMWNAFSLTDEVEAAMRLIEERLLYGPPPRPAQILHVVLFAGCGRPGMFGLGGPAPPLEAPRIMLSPEALHTISLAGTDQCDIWKFAEASDRLRETAQVMPASPLDEYAAWRDNGRSFYFGDDGRPTFVVFDSSYGRALRDRVAQERDLHPAWTPDLAVTEVIRVHDDPAIQIYVAVADLADRSTSGPRMLVEDGPVPIWVTSAGDPTDDHRAAYAQLVDCVAYWLWQISASLQELSALVEHEPVTVKLELDTPEAWSNEAPADDVGPVATVETDPDAPGLRLVVHPAMVARLDQANNVAERELVRTLLVGFRTLAVDLGAPVPDRADLDAAVELAAPLGPKKKINLMRSVADVALLDGPLPPYRRLQDADAEALLDRIGTLVRDRFGLEDGSIPADQHGDVLNLAVEYHFEEFARLAGTLDPAGLLETLVAAHEAALHHEAVFRRTFAARAACFDETKLIEDMREEIPRAAGTSIALRFTIEYVVAQPPRGIRPLSLDLLDRILALASQIVNRGLASDIVRYELDDLDLSMLPSGRLGVDRTAGYYSGQEAYLDAVVPVHARTARERYAEHWEPRPDGRPAIADQLDTAAEAEWGLTMTEIAELHGELVFAATRRSMAVASADRAELVDELSESLGTEPERIKRGLEMLTLGPRPSFLSPPPPFARADVYPWRFNRELSYIRRPLLLRPTPNGEEIVWGPRHVDAAGHQLLTLVMTERLKARSAPMRKLMTRLRQEETAEFVQEVGRRCSGAGMVVRTNVRKIAGKRITKPDGDDAGDLDTLAADPASHVIHVLECKDLEAARTPAELHNELERTFATGGQKRSAADKHLDRIAWVEEHLSEVVTWLGLQGDPNAWAVVGGFIVDSEVLSPYVYDCPLPVTPISRLLEGLQAATERTGARP